MCCDSSAVGRELMSVSFDSTGGALWWEYRGASARACLFEVLVSWSNVPVRLVITDAMWSRIEPLMPADPARGRRWADHRRTLEAIAWKYRTCSPWRDLPEELGSFKTAHKRLLRWAVDGTWERIFAAVLGAADAEDHISWTASVDSTVCRAHQHAAGARKRGWLHGTSPTITRSDVPAAV